MRGFAFLSALLLFASQADAKSSGLTVKTGETWLFSLSAGQPVNAKRAHPDAKPAPGQIQVTVRSLLGTTMTLTSNNQQAYVYQAELVGSGKATPARSCTLPANNRLSFENWPQSATAVRIHDFRVATKDGSCP